MREVGGGVRAGSRWAAVAIVTTALLACGCARSAEEDDLSAKPIVVYSGRNEVLIGPLLERFEHDSGLEVRVRYASTSELVATLLEEGHATPADIFVSQDAAALGALAAAGRLKPLSQELLSRVEPRFSAPRGEWIGISGRARCLVYAPERIDADQLPTSIDELGDERFRGRFGVAPANGSFQAHMAVYRTLRGADALRRLLAGIVANQPGRYAQNSAIVEAVIAGEIDFGVVNHYYLWRAKAENPAVSAENFFMTDDEASSFINLAGAGVLSDRPGAERLIAYLLSDEAQAYFAAETFEYPLVPGIRSSLNLTPLAEIDTPDVDYGAVSAALSATLSDIVDSGLLD